MTLSTGEIEVESDSPIMGSESGSLQDTARERIKAKILDGDFTAGDPLSEESIAADLKMSRTPVRQAFQELIALGLLERVRGRGVIVSRIDLRRILDIIEVQRCLLEWAITRASDLPELPLDKVLETYHRQQNAASRGDYKTVRVEARRMDVALVALTGNREMERYMREISDLLLHAASQALVTSGEYQDAIREHGEIIAALRARDFGGATKAVRVHFDGIHRRLSGYRR